MNQSLKNKASTLKVTTMKSSYAAEDCIFLMKDVSDRITETTTEEKEQSISQGVHYSEMLPKEYSPTNEYLQLFYQTLQHSSLTVAQYVANVAKIIWEAKGKDVILVSLARAGTPIGVLIKQWMKHYYGVDVPHYSISIIRGKGFDENAVAYIVNKHQSVNLQFIDGWTGKGAINEVLKQSVAAFQEKYEVRLDAELAVLADPSHATTIFGTREDFLIPSACLNSTVSGLVSRTFHRADIIGENEFHGAKYYAEWESIDVSLLFIEEITKHFEQVTPLDVEKADATNKGIKQVIVIQKHFHIADINKVKPGIGETTRVLLRRVPWKILVNDLANPHLQHILLLAKERNVIVEEFHEMTYSCIGLIKE